MRKTATRPATVSTLFAIVASAGLMAACGGSDPPPPPPPPPSSSSNTSTVTLTGIASKGLMANADVAVFAVNSDGSVASTALATGTTSAGGAYSLNFTGTAGAPYVIRVNARADGTTTHLDEIRGRQVLPADYALRALTIPATSGAVSVSATVTPFSEMAAAAAGRASGGITAANARQANSTLSQLLGFNPIAAPSPSTAAGAGSSAQQLAVMLTAVSQLAADGALGCTTGPAAAQTLCVTRKLAESSSSSTMKLQSGSLDVSAELSRALATVLANPALTGAVPISSLTVAQANLACTGSTCTAAPPSDDPPPGPTATALAIASAKQFFTTVKSDFATLFSRGGDTAAATGAANAQAFKFRSAMEGVQVPVEVLAKDLGVLLMAADFYNDYVSGRDPLNTRGRAPGEFDTDTGGLDMFDATACGIYSDSAATILATSPAEANFIGCRAVYYARLDPVTRVRSEWRHGFTLTPAAGGRFDYTTRARLRTTPCVAPACTNFNIALQPDFYAGTLLTTTNSAGNITGFSVSGGLPAAFVQNQNTLFNERHEWELQGTRAISGFKQETSTLTGVVRAYAAGGVLQGTLTVREGSTLSEMPVTADSTLPGTGNPATQGMVGSGALNLAWTTPAAEFDGSFALSNGTWDATGTAYAPTRLVFTGSLRTVTGGVTAEFLSGNLTAAITGFATYDATQLPSASNRYTENLSFIGAVTAPDRPRLEFSVGGTKTSELLDFSSLTLQYRAIVGGVPRTVVGATATLGLDGLYTYALTEAGADLRLSWSDTATMSDLFKGSTRIGTLDASTGLLTFVDGSFISLDVGL